MRKVNSSWVASTKNSETEAVVSFVWCRPDSDGSFTVLGACDTHTHTHRYMHTHTHTCIHTNTPADTQLLLHHSLVDQQNTIIICITITVNGIKLNNF